MTKMKSSNQTQARASTPAGRERESSGERRAGESPQIPAAEASPAPRSTKQALILGLLQRPEGKPRRPRGGHGLAAPPPARP